MRKWRYEIESGLVILIANYKIFHSIRPRVLEENGDISLKVGQQYWLLDKTIQSTIRNWWPDLECGSFILTATYIFNNSKIHLKINISNNNFKIHFIGKHNTFLFIVQTLFAICFL